MPRRDRIAAGLALGLVLAVVLAAAGIRLEIGIPGLRIVHRIAASLEVVVVLWLAWRQWRRPAVQIALVLTATLSVIGIVGGQQPPPAIAAANLLGGLALAATFAWILGTPGSRPHARGPSVAPLVLFLLAAQAALGAWLSIVELYGAALPAHAMLGLALAALLSWIARGRLLLASLALAAPLAGFSALHYEYSALAALAHAAAAAALLAGSAYALARAA